MNHCRLFLFLLLTQIFKYSIGIAQISPEDLLRKADSSKNPYLYIKNGKLALEIATNPSDSLLGMIENNIGIGYGMTGAYDSAIFIFQKVVKERTTPRVKAIAYNGLGNVYRIMGQYEKSLDCFFKSVDINAKTQNANLSANYSNIAGIYYEMTDYEKALEYCYKSNEFNKKNNIQQEIAFDYMTIGIIYAKLGDIKKALEYQLKARPVFEKLKDSTNMAVNYGHLAGLYLQNDDLKKCEELLMLSSKIVEVYKDPELMVSNFLLQSSIEERRNSYDEAILSLNKALNDSKNYNLPYLKIQTLSELSKVYRKIRDNEKAFYFLEQYYNMKDSLHNIDLEKQIANMEFAHQVKEKQNEIDMLNKQNALHKIILKQRDRSITYLSVSGLLSLLFVFYFFYENKKRKRLTQKLSEKKQELEQMNNEINQRNEEIKSQRDDIGLKNIQLSSMNSDLEKKNTEILDSIRYAMNIQRAILPSKKIFEKAFSDYLIFYQPKDLISGDIYWLNEVEEGQYILVVVDCTGHGIPGALMSMMAHELLNQLIMVKKNSDPSVIIDKLHTLLQKNKESEDTYGPGMDAAVLKIDKKNSKILFSGAKCPIVYSKENELQLIKGAPFSIGGYDKNKKFNFPVHEINTDGFCYLFTDGIRDQFGGQHNKKLLLKNLYKILSNTINESGECQLDNITNSLNEWKGNQEQIDDMTMIGIKL